MFGGGAGHIADMIARMKANKELLDRKSYFHIKHVYGKVTNRKKLRFKKASEEELEVIRKRSFAERKRDALKSFLALAITGVIASVLIYLLILVIKKQV